MSLAVEMGTKVGRDSLYYTIVSTIIFPIGLFNALVLTHYLTTTEYGQLSVLFVASGLTTVVLNLFFLRGTERRVWGSSDEGIDVDTAELIESHKRPRALGTGIVLSALLALITVAAVIPVATPLSHWLLHTRRLQTAVIWAAVSAGLGSVFRLVWNIVRWERRHVAFGVVYVLRPVLAVVITLPLVMSGGGVTGAVAGTAIATALASAYGLAVSRRSYSLVLERQSATEIVRSSASFAAMLVGLYALHNGDVILLSRYASQAQVGIYRLAGNVTSIISYAVSAFLMAWAPLEHSSLFEAAYERHGRDRMRGEFIVYYLIMGFALTLVMSVLATPLVGIFSPRYGKAGDFVAITSLGWVAYGLFIVLARSSSFPRRYFVYGIAAVASSLGLIGSSLFLGPALGGYGVAIGDVVGGLLGAGLIAAVAAARGALPRVSVWRLTALIGIGAACYVLGGPVAVAAHRWNAPLKAISILLYPLLLAAMGVIPARQFSALWSIVRNTLRSRSRPEELIEAVNGLPATERRVLLAIVRDGVPSARAAAQLGITEENLRVRLVAALRQVADAGSPGQHDGAIGDYLLAGWSATQRDGAARELWDVGIEPVDLHKIDSAFNILRSASPKAWVSPVLPKRYLPPSGFWPLGAADVELIDAVVRKRLPRPAVADELGIPQQELDVRLVRALRRLLGEDRKDPADALIAGFLLDDLTPVPTPQLWATGVDPLELHQLELVVAEIRSLPRDQWRKITAEAVAFEEQREGVLEQVQP